MMNKSPSIEQEIKDYIEFYHRESYNELDLEEKAYLAAILESKEPQRFSLGKFDWLYYSNDPTNVTTCFCKLILNNSLKQEVKKERTENLLTAMKESLVNYHEQSIIDIFNMIYKTKRIAS